jgi:hypothetical protein
VPPFAEIKRERERTNRPDPKEKIKLFLSVCKIEQMPNESMMETWARALGTLSRELRSLLKAGIDPIHKYLKEIRENKTHAAAKPDTIRLAEEDFPCVLQRSSQPA